MASNEAFDYMCGLCREQFNDLVQHVVQAGHEDNQTLMVGCKAISEHTGQFGYSMTRFQTTYGAIRRRIQEGRGVFVKDRKLIYTARHLPPLDYSSTYEEDLDITIPASTLFTGDYDVQLYKALMDLLPAAVSELSKRENYTRIDLDRCLH